MVEYATEHYGKLLLALVGLLLLIMVYRMISDGTWNPTPGPVGRYQAVVLPSGGGLEGGFQLDSSWFVLDTATGKTYIGKHVEEGLDTWVQANKAIGEQ
jgi:hypothetical protein